MRLSTRFDRVDYFVSNADDYGRSVVEGMEIMKLRTMKGLLNIYIATVGALSSGLKRL